VKIEVKLKDPKYCDGCPCIDYGGDTWESCCNLNFWDNNACLNTNERVWDGNKPHYNRPAACKAAHGD
jgi:hypothetical protein